MDIKDALKAATVGPLVAVNNHRQLKQDGVGRYATRPDIADIHTLGTHAGRKANAAVLAHGFNLLQAGIVDALEAMVEYYIELVDSGDCGNWNPEETPVVQRCRTLLAQAKEVKGI